MSATNDGGPAFPHGEIVLEIRGENGEIIGSRVYDPCPGMSLRDWFAGQALAGMDCVGQYNETMARRSYELADAMLSARNGGRT